ncbi:lysosome-associated membrane glycoprotein 1 [Hyperolius riggenbachi]|uniref:lysosome-associated membrane glycoprotein 1 n=1 Tax=Hyperolius riggenbachi TaxID=752182 RepID=UPI0035A3A4B3
MKADGQWGLREAVLCTALVFGVFSSVSCVRFEVKDSKNVTCILADLSVNFTVGYNSSKKLETASFLLPANASVDSSSTCSDNVTKIPLLAIKFGNGSLLSINFTKSVATYQVDDLVFTYNLSDKVLFPDAADNGTKAVSSKSSEISAKANFAYRCSNPHLITMGEVKLTLHDVKLEAFMTSSNYSKDESLCKEDIAPTSAPTVPPTTAPVNPKTPEVGKYRVNGSSGACLLAEMGLQLNFTYTNKTDKVATYEFNIDPKRVSVGGECHNSSVTLTLSSAGLDLLFNFTLNNTANKFYLSQVHINTSVIPDDKDPDFTADNSSLSYLQTTTRKSFKCNAKQTFQINNNFSIVTYNLQIQAFNFDENKFGPAVECTEDQNGMLVPIVVGAALAGLVLIVLIAYLIGRKRSHAGYQTI